MQTAQQYENVESKIIPECERFDDEELTDDEILAIEDYERRKAEGSVVTISSQEMRTYIETSENFG